MAKFARLVPVGRLQTPIRAFRHPQTGRRVTVVATNHYGTSGYYQRLLHAITVLQRGGATVLREGSDMVVDDHVEATAAEQSAIHGMRTLHTHLAVMFTTRYGWTHEHVAFGRHDDWQYIDLSHQAVVQQAGADTYQHTVDSANTNKKGQVRDPRQLQALMFLATTVSFRAISAAPAFLQPKVGGSDLDPTILEQRDKLILDAIDSLDGDAVPVWGARHLIGLTAGLTARGYEHTGRDTWHTVGHLPPVSTALWHLLKTNRVVKRDTTTTAADQ